MGKEAKDYLPGLGNAFHVKSDEIDFEPQVQANSTATDVAGLKADLNALLAKLRAAGVIK